MNDTTVSRTSIPWARRSIGAVATAAVLIVGVPVRAQAPAASVAPLNEQRIIQQASASVDRALEHLARKQKLDGSWNSGNGKSNAVNALALLAFLGRGHVPGRGPYREVLDRGRRHLLATQNPAGFLGGTMYDHGLATLCLVEMYGMTQDPELEPKVRKAVGLIVQCQSANGGWRYAPHPGDADLSVTVMQVVALRAALNADLPVPQVTIDRAIGYVKSCAVRSGGFSYQPGGGVTPQVTAGGVLSMQLCGRYDDPLVQKGLDYLAKIQPTWGGPLQYYYYFHYYAVQGMYQAGGKYWNAWHPRIRQTLLARQNADGSWDVPVGAESSVAGPDKVYSTAMACLVLEIYMHFLPAYQR